MNNSKEIELLSPAPDKEAAKEAILHGADAVYIGGPSHGARKSASNSLDDIAEVVDFAHKFRAKVYVTVNTIIYEGELKKVRDLIRDLYHIGVDAIIIQDMGILRMEIPPISLHASTQCDIRTPEKAIFLEKVGFSQLVIERALSLNEIKAITSSVNIPVEAFIHGALCVSYSGKCHASFKTTGRSANRGECAQLCRLPYDLIDSEGREIMKQKYLLSLKDLNLSHNLEDLIKAGVTSFKIEGRLKEKDYVKNVTAHYNKRINEILNKFGDLRRSSYGKVVAEFDPNPVKSFNRGFTSYFIKNLTPQNLASLETPKSIGEKIEDVRKLNRGDGISFFDKKGELAGANVNGIEKGKIITHNRLEVPTKSPVYRTSDIAWQKKMRGKTSQRKIDLYLSLSPHAIVAKDEIGNQIELNWETEFENARNQQDIFKEFNKLGNTIFQLKEFKSTLPKDVFIPPSVLSSLRRRVIEKLEEANISDYVRQIRKSEDFDVIYPLKSLDFRENVANSLAKAFYLDHGVEKIEDAIEVSSTSKRDSQVLMTTRHCVLRELGLCKKKRTLCYKEPLILKNGNMELHIQFDCKNCEMKIIG